MDRPFYTLKIVNWRNDQNFLAKLAQKITCLWKRLLKKKDKLPLVVRCSQMNPIQTYHHTVKNYYASMCLSSWSMKFLSLLLLLHCMVSGFLGSLSHILWRSYKGFDQSWLTYMYSRQHYIIQHQFMVHGWQMKNALYLSVNVISMKVLIGDTIFYVSNWRWGRHFMWSSESHEGLAICSARAVPILRPWVLVRPQGIEPATSHTAVNTLYRLS